MCRLIEANLELCQVAKEQRSLIQAEAVDFLKQAVKKISQEKTESWDIVFFDPPYATGYLQALEIIANVTPGLVTANGLLIVEHHHKKELPDQLSALHRTRVLKQGDSALSFYAMDLV